MVGQPHRPSLAPWDASSRLALEHLSQLAFQGATELQMILAVDEVLFRWALGQADRSGFWQWAEALQGAVDAIASDATETVGQAGTGAGRGDVERRGLGMRVVRDRIAAVIAG